jgi:tryptophan-rich sensory protein
MKKFHGKTFWICVGIVFAVAIITFLLSLRGLIPSWNFSPFKGIILHSWIFPLVWIVMYTLIGFSLYLTLKESSNAAKKAAGVLFGINLALAVIWHILFFTMNHANYAFYGAIALGISILPMFLFSLKMKRSAGLILIPYFLWVILLTFFNFVLGFQ